MVTIGTMASYILGPIRNMYLALHQGTDSAPTRFSTSTGDQDDILKEPSSYPVCNVPGHHSDSTSHIHDDHASMTFTPAVPDDHDNIALVPSLASPDPPLSSTHAPLPVDETLTAALDKNSVPVSLQPVHRRRRPKFATFSPLHRVWSPLVRCTEA